MKSAFYVFFISVTFLGASTIMAQGLPMTTQPVFSGAIINGPGSMVWEQGKASGSGRICGQTYSDDNQKAVLLARQARGQCGTINSLTIKNKNFTSNLLASSVKSAAASISALTFQSSSQVRKQNFANFVEKIRASDPAGAAKMQQFFASTDIIAAIGNGMASYGLRTNNLADAYAVYWTNAWLGSRGRNEDLPKAQMITVRNQAVSALLATPSVEAASDAQKQQMAEAMLVQAAMISAYIDNAKSDPVLMTKVKAAIAQGAKAMGLDLYMMTLTANGFAPAKKGSAVEENDEGQLAAVPATTDTTSPNYPLIAAAGGAGLGGMFLLGKAMSKKG